MQKFFEDDWLTFNVEKDSSGLAKKVLAWNISDDVRIAPGTLFDSMIGVTRRMDLGDVPYVSLSGGVDSQAICLLLREAGIDFTIAIMRFKGDHNRMDVDHAFEFCYKHRFKYRVIDLDLMSFLVRDLHKYAVKYECPSPQFNTHFKFYEALIDLGATSILAGGQAPFFVNRELEYHATRSQNAWTTFAKVNNFKLYGNFLGWSFDMAAPLIIATPNIAERSEAVALRYNAKVQGMKALGLDVTPQDKKYTGFEYFKEHLAEMTGDGWSFERSFRYPYSDKLPDYLGVLKRPLIAAELLRLNLEFNKL